MSCHCPPLFSHAGITLRKARSAHCLEGDFGRLCAAIDHLAGGKLLMASEQHQVAEMPAEMFVATPLPKEQDSLSIPFDGLCRLVFYLDSQAAAADMTDPTLILN